MHTGAKHKRRVFQCIHILTKLVPSCSELLGAVMLTEVEILRWHHNLCRRADKKIEQDNDKLLADCLKNRWICSEFLEPQTFSFDHSTYEVEISFGDLRYVSI